VKRSSIALLHAGYWAVYLLLLVVVFATLRLQVRPPASLWTALLGSRIGLVAIGPNLVAFYLSYFLLFPWLERRRIAALLAFGALACAASVALVPLGMYLALGADQPFFSDRTELLALLAWLSVVASIHMTIALVLRGFVRWFGDRKWKEELERRTREVEMALLRSKIDPHFLFNTLNNIDVLITKDPATASAYLNQLSDILRFVLYETAAPAIPLAKELAYIEKYIALERLRTRSPRYVAFEVAGDPSGLQVAPMVFIPFIENAFKHTEGQKTDDAIAVRFDIDGGRLTFLCRNRSRPEIGAKGDPGGLGNELIRGRLALLYPGRHSLAVTELEDSYTIRLTVDLDDPPLHPR
jgi:hypothetical protein